MGLFKTIGGLETGSFFGSEKITRRPEPDADTLMIVAGPCGSGKSSILQAAYNENLPLFGADYQACFRKSCKDKAYVEYPDFKKALRKKSFFQARHVKSLMLEDSLPRFALLHVDLYQVLLGIDPSFYPRSLKMREALRAIRLGKNVKKKRTASKRGKRSFASLQVASENDQMMRYYLQHPFFRRYKHILVNTVHCNFSDTARQLAVRKEKRSSNSRTLEQCRNKYFLAPEAIAKSIHRELYASWERNLSILAPAALFTTQVSESGDLLVNGSLLVADWSKRFQRISY